MDREPARSIDTGTPQILVLRRRLASARRLLVLALLALLASAAMIHVHADMARENRERLAAASAADRFVELAVRARLMLAVDPNVATNAALVADGLFDNRAVHADWEGPVEIRWAMVAGDPGVFVLELSGMPRRACPWFATRVLQRAHETRASGVWINEAAYAFDDGAGFAPVDRSSPPAAPSDPGSSAVCGERNSVALLILLHSSAPALPQKPALRQA